MTTRIITQGNPAQGLVVDDSSDLPTTRIVARGLLDMAAGAGAGAWVGAHPGFANAIVSNGVGDFTVHLSSDGNPATMFARCNASDQGSGAAQAAVLGGAGNRDLRVKCAKYEGADSNPGGWGAGAHLGAAIATNQAVVIEVIDFA